MSPGKSFSDPSWPWRAVRVNEETPARFWRMVALSQAMVQTGLSTLAGQGLLRLTSPFGPLGLAGGGFLLAALLTQFMGGQVTALVAG